MKSVLGLLCLLILGSVCQSENSTESVEDDSQIFEVSNNQLVNSFDDPTSTLQDETTTNTTSEKSKDTLNVDTKCFFLWPWFNWLLGCVERICFARGAYSYIPVCGYDSSQGYRTFKNRCFLNATNTCYSTSYTLNATTECS